MEATKQLTFRLPEGLVARVERCVARFRATGLNLTRADLVRMLLTYALDDAGCDVQRLLAPTARTRRR